MTGLTYLRARYLDPSLGRFLSMDTVKPNAPGTQGYNRCSYVANNPATWSDPSGNSVERLVCMQAVNQAISIAAQKMLRINLFAKAKGVLVARHSRGFYVIGISAVFVAAGAGAQMLAENAEFVRAGLALAGGLLVGNSLAISVWAAGAPHISMPTFASILLAGVLLLLVGAILQKLGEFLEQILFIWRSYSPGGAICRYLEKHGRLPDIPLVSGPQSPRSGDGTGLQQQNNAMPRTPSIPRPQPGQ